MSTPDREYPLTASDFATISRILRDDAGIHLPASKEALVYTRLAKRLRSLGLRSFREYCAIIDGPTPERAKLISALTTNVTSFFREAHHFEHLKQQVLPGLFAAAKSGGKIRIWSAGCSTGPEPYSIALTILSLLPDARSYDIRILATDINPEVIETARLARYGPEELSRVPADSRKRWLEPAAGGGFKLDLAVTSLVTFRVLNLIETWPMRGPFDVIFCRNVTIYFEERTQETVWSRMADLLTGNGMLYAGHSERISGPASGVLNTAGTTAYRRAERAAA